MKGIKFHKMVGAGNNFIVIDNRRRSIKNAASLAREVCDPNYGVGADGLVLLEKSRKADLLMRIVNADGSEAEMCGNATRCVALYADQLMHLGRELHLETVAGQYRTKIIGSRVISSFPVPRDYRSAAEISVEGKKFTYYSVNTGVPHAVIFEKNLEKFPVEQHGRSIRYHKQFVPAGTNCNFVRVINKHSLQIRTYERGVEGETLACGTGAVASAVVSVKEGYCSAPVKLLTKSGEYLTVNFNQRACCIEGVTLEGPAKFICEGVLV